MTTRPCSTDPDYTCDTCGRVFSGDLVTGLRQELEEMLDMTDKYDAPNLQFLLQVCVNIFLQIKSMF